MLSIMYLIQKKTKDTEYYQELHQFSEYENLSFNTEEEL